MVTSGPSVALCAPELRGAALEVLYQRVPAALRARLIFEVLEEARHGEIDLSGLWIAQARYGKVTGALLTQSLVGRTATVWAPEMRPSRGRSAQAAALVQGALTDLRARGFCLAQAVPHKSAGLQARCDLDRGGMPRVTELLYLVRATADPLPLVHQVSVESGGSTVGSRVKRPSHLRPTDGPRCFQWRPFEPTLEAEFRDVLQATYVGSLDMPELDGVRSIKDIMDGYRAAVKFVTNHWWLGRVQGEPKAAAVLLLAEIPARDVWELTYMGLTPSARGNGLGISVLQHALELARSHVSWLELAVDCRNFPALQLYKAAGFIVCERRDVHLAILQRSP